MPGMPTVEDYSPLSNVGVLLPTCTTRIGVTPRSAIVHQSTMSGHISNPQPGTRASAAYRRQTALRGKIDEIGEDGIRN